MIKTGVKSFHCLFTINEINRTDDILKIRAGGGKTLECRTDFFKSICRRLELRINRSKVRKR
jgi:hypothetical protein